MATPPSAPSLGKPPDFPQPFQQYDGTYSFRVVVESHLIHPFSLHDGEGSSFPGNGPPDDTFNSECVMGIKGCDSCVMIGYQVD